MRLEKDQIRTTQRPKDQSSATRIVGCRLVVDFTVEGRLGLSDCSRHHGDVVCTLLEGPGVEVVLLLEKGLIRDVGHQAAHEYMVSRHTDGISTATSTSYFVESLPLTAVLVAQLPARSISDGFSNETFQFVSSVGSGRTYGTSTPSLERVREACRGC